jgi:hypothetical protein
MAVRPKARHHSRVPAWNSFSFAYGPIVAVALIGLFAVILRWAFGRGTSVVAAPPRPGPSEDYGLLVVVASPSNDTEGRLLCQRLAAQGVRANLVSTLDGPRVMVWPADEALARSVLAR